MYITLVRQGTIMSHQKSFMSYDKRVGEFDGLPTKGVTQRRGAEHQGKHSQVVISQDELWQFNAGWRLCVDGKVVRVVHHESVYLGAIFWRWVFRQCHDACKVNNRYLDRQEKLDTWPATLTQSVKGRQSFWLSQVKRISSTSRTTTWSELSAKEAIKWR